MFSGYIPVGNLRWVHDSPSLMCCSFPSPVSWMKRHPTFVHVPPFPTMMETRSDRCFYIYHRIRALHAKACVKSYDKWKKLTKPSEVLIVPKPKEKKKTSTAVPPCMPACTMSLPPKLPLMTDTTIPHWRGNRLGRFSIRGNSVVHSIGYSVTVFNMPRRHHQMNPSVLCGIAESIFKSHTSTCHILTYFPYP